jgi:HPt (histidine-containing phosphotransfer) domain-containing protein
LAYRGFSMVLRNSDAAALSMPGGESFGPTRHRPIDLEHLSRQTMGDRALESEVLQLFVHQAMSVRRQIVSANLKERLLLAHGLKGSARGVGAFAIGDCVAELEESPEDRLILGRLEGLIDEVHDFVAAISR